MTLDLFDYADVPALRFTIADKSCLRQTSAVDELIQQLIALRGRLDPPQPREPVRSSNYPLEMDPCWYVEHSPLLGPSFSCGTLEWAGWLIRCQRRVSSGFAWR